MAQCRHPPGWPHAERLIQERTLELLDQAEISLFAIDEAHCVSQWGHDFRPDYSRVNEIRERLGNPTIIALTATATAECRRDIYRQLGGVGHGKPYLMVATVGNSYQQFKQFSSKVAVQVDTDKIDFR